MNKFSKAFTLLELVIVIIVIGVLASLALPRLYRSIERARAAEGLAGIAYLRSALERCHLINNLDYSKCHFGNSFENFGVEDPGDAPNSHFEYYVVAADFSTRIYATRNSRNASGSPVVTDTNQYQFPECGAEGAVTPLVPVWNDRIASLMFRGGNCGHIDGTGAYEGMHW